jgi:diguanylate cyclase (GGDEF)-like protein
VKVRRQWREDSSQARARPDRLGVLHGVRVLMALTVLGTAYFTPDAVGFHVGDVGRPAGLYVLAAIATDVARRDERVRAAGAIWAMLIVDALFLSIVLFVEDGPSSPLIFLVSVHLITVALLVGYRAAIKVAVWYSALFVGLDQLRRHHIVGGFGGGPYSVSSHEVALRILALWAVVVCTAALAAVNERELRLGQEELRALASMGTLLEQADGPEAAASVVLESVTRTFPFQRGAVVAGTEAGWFALGSDGHKPVQLNRGRPVRPDDVVRRCWGHRTCLLVTRLDADRDPVLAQLLPRAANVLVVPLVADGQPLGALALEWGGRLNSRIPTAIVATVTQFAAHAALSLRNASLHAKVERLAATDALTGLVNRRVFEKVLEREVARSWRSEQPLSLIVLDVDHFKAVNDSYGHQAGDEVLRHVGQALAAQCRGVDVAARYGGEEFAVILPGCPPADALGVAERIRAAVADCASPVSVTCSAGVAGVPLNAADGQALVAAADHALYESKRRGRDRTTRSRRRRRGLRPVVGSTG